MKILLVGAGGIGPEYVKALRSAGISRIDVFSRRLQSAQDFAGRHQLCKAFASEQVQLGELVSDYDGVIIASSIESLLPLLRQCVECAPNVPVLVEKPVSLSSAELAAFNATAPQSRISVALNRLYFPSVSFMRQRLLEEPATSATFSFTEWIHRIDPSAYSRNELLRWGLSNCIHVTGTVFTLIGVPDAISAYVGGRDVISWHPNCCIFAGAGKTDRGVPFSYNSDWTSAGRWSIAIHTEAGRYDLMPMESVMFTKKGTVSTMPLVENYSGETKCGFVEMITQWLRPEGDEPNVGLAEMTNYLAATEQIFGYET